MVRLGGIRPRPVARVLAEIWRQGLSGSLYVRADGRSEVPVLRARLARPRFRVVRGKGFPAFPPDHRPDRPHRPDPGRGTRPEDRGLDAPVPRRDLALRAGPSLGPPPDLRPGGGPVALRERRGRARIPHPERPAGPGLRRRPSTSPAFCSRAPGG
ncbi:MAG: hypothetical protein MZV64_34240 [Ignavibacteriales bacterium]|nr:hypothetical protein [Ignavibacteriales bacterium]